MQNNTYYSAKSRWKKQQHEPDAAQPEISNSHPDVSQSEQSSNNPDVGQLITSWKYSYVDHPTITNNNRRGAIPSYITCSHTRQAVHLSTGDTTPEDVAHRQWQNVKKK